MALNDQALIIRKLGGPSTDQIVKYGDRSIVTYDDSEKMIKVTQLRGSPAHFKVQRECPLCGQPVNIDSMSYEAHAYFALLQRALKRWREQPTRRKGSRAPSTTHIPVLTSSPEKNPFSEDAAEGNSGLAEAEAVILEDLPSHLLVNRYYETFFDESRRLGSGAFGEVYQCQHRLDELVLGSYAVKKIPVGDSRKWLHKVIREVKMRESLNHHNIVSYKHSWLELVHSNAFNAPKVPYLFVLMEYCDGGDLEQFIHNTYFRKVASPDQSADLTNIPQISDPIVWTLFIDVLTGLQYLHHAGIIHRDLKPSNIMLKLGTENLPELGECTTAHALLADFGTAEYVKGSRRSGLGFTGTVEYTAPELLEKDETGCYTADYDYKSDMWSLGWILYALAYGAHPFGEGNDGPEGVRQSLMKFREQVIEQPITPDMFPIQPSLRGAIVRPLGMRQVIAALLDPTPAKRPSCDFLLNHDYLKEIRLGLEREVDARVAAAVMCHPE